MGRITKEKLSLRVTLTDEELKVFSRNMADKLREKADKEATLKSVAAQYKSEIETCNATVQEMAEKVRSGYEFRGVECLVLYDWDKRVKSWIRGDTGEVAKEDVISEADLQEEMYLREKVAKAEQKAADAQASGKAEVVQTHEQDEQKALPAPSQAVDAEFKVVE